MQNLTSIKANLVDVVNQRIYPALVSIEHGIIKSITELDETLNTYILTGFIDAHVHIESSMLTPNEFARIAVMHGTVATISDPHEIANVLGVKGVEYMLDNAKQTPFYFYFGAPSCVPATSFETAGAIINAEDIDFLLQKKEIVYLAEMMNYPGVIYKDKDVLKKLEVAKKYNKPIDGHAPGLKGDTMKAYFNAGITTDHECFEYQEAYDKLKHGVNIMIREGSAAKNFETLIPLLAEFPNQIMFCCDDKHPDNLLEGHINEHVKRAIRKGHKLFDVLRAASYNVIKHYNLPVGMLQLNDAADFIEVNNLTDFKVLQTIIKGQIVSKNNESFIPYQSAPLANLFNCDKKSVDDFSIKTISEKIRVIEVLDGQLITNEIICDVTTDNEFSISSVKNDVLKIAVVNRYLNAPVAIGFIKNFGLKTGAIASCVAHDCHNIVAVGVSDNDICNAVNAIIESKGGISLANETEILIQALPIAGIMSPQPAQEVAQQYIQLDKRAKELGCTLKAPYMSLSFMALLVIPNLKLSDKGLFNGNTFAFTEVFVQ
jgi:adenine deaminase